MRSALSLVGMDDPQLKVRAVLKTCLVKRAEDESRFDDLFGLFFFRAADLLVVAGCAAGGGFWPSGFSEEQIERAMAALGLAEAARFDPTARLGLGLRRGLDLLLRLSGLRIDVSRMQKLAANRLFHPGAYRSVWVSPGRVGAARADEPAVARAWAELAADGASAGGTEPVAAPRRLRGEVQRV